MANNPKDITPAVLLKHMQAMEKRLHGDMAHMEVGLRQEMATKDDLKAMATKDDLKAMATKDDLKAMATKDDLKEMEGRLNRRIDGLEKYADRILTIVENVHKRLESLEKRVKAIEAIPPIKEALRAA